jgi:hypothetical protein
MFENLLLFANIESKDRQISKIDNLKMTFISIIGHACNL